MRALSLWQPWASLVAAGRKTFETRSWRTHLRGPIAIHAAQRPRGMTARVYEQLDDLTLEHLGVPLGALPLGCYVAVAAIASCVPTEELNPGPAERALGNYAPGRYAFGLVDVVALAPPVYARGSQRIYVLTPDVDRLVAAALEAARARV